MGLGLEIDAPIPPRWQSGRSADGAELVEQLMDACRSCIDDPLLRRLARFRRANDGHAFELWLHPATEPIELKVDVGRVTCSAKTNPAGPGYHVYVVELLERVAQVANLEWRWNDADGEAGDECEYHQTRSFDTVRRHMLGWLRALARGLDGIEAGSAVHVSLPMGFSPVRPGPICTPLGPVDQEWPRRVTSAGESELEVIGSQFFPWWEPGLDARFWAQYGTAIAWVDVPWHAPSSEDETWASGAALAAFERSRALDPEIVLPDLEIAELRRYHRAEPGEARPPNPAGIGYRRGLMRWQLTGAWSLEAPGYWYDELDDGTVVLGFGDRTIRITTYVADGVSADRLVAIRVASERRESARVEWRSNHLHARGSIEWTDDQNGYWVLVGQVATDGHLCSATISYENESDRSWAEETFRSISRPPP